MTINKKEVAALTINGKVVSSMTINGKMVYSGIKKDLSLCTIEAVYSKVLYTGEPVTTWIEITDPEETEGTHLVEDVDYTLEWFDNVEVGTARVVATGKGKYQGTLETTFEVMSNDISTEGYDFEIAPDVFPDDAPSFDVEIVTAKDSAYNHMVEGEDFYQTNDNAGTVTITGIGKYVGSTTRTYRIIDTVNYLTFTAKADNSSLKLEKSGSPDPIALEYKVDDDAWSTYEIGADIPLNAEQKVQFRGNNTTFSKDAQKFYRFRMTGKIAASGSVMTLIDQTDKHRTVGNNEFIKLFDVCSSLTTAPELPATYLNDSCYYSMFNGCTSLTQVPELPATLLASQCYTYMFSSCTSLTQAPELPATTLVSNCYGYMFWRCTSLTQAPELPATTLAQNCYQNMFNGCTALTQAPELPVTTLAQNCYQGMFNGCTALTQAPELPATTLKSSCYNSMFQGCTSLTEAPELPATTLAGTCYQNMFKTCTALTQAPELPATTLASYCYNWMFQGCSALTKAPKLPATTLASYCYYSMFINCRSLTEAPELPATTLFDSCYYGMFQGCRALTNAPKLPATTLANNCYYYMFSGCTSLTKAPELPATTLVNNCYKFMFDGCTNLNYISVKFTVWHSSGTTNWVSNVAASGKFICPAELTDYYNASRIPTGWTRQEADYLTFTALENGSTIALNAVGSPDPINLEYRTSHEDTWHPYTVGDTLSMMSGWTLELRGDNLSIGKAQNDYYQFAMTGQYAASGSIMTLIDKTDTMRTVPSFCFRKLFSGCSALTTAPELPATTVMNSGYRSMFQQSGLTEAPELPATMLGELAYSAMFSACSALTKAPNMLPATYLPNQVYNSMFSECTSLEVAPEIMASDWRADGIASNQVTLMFQNCSSLRYAKVHISEWVSGTSSNWMQGVASTGELHCNNALPDNPGASRNPSGWTLVRDVA